MQAILTQLLVSIVTQLLTPDLIKQGEASFVNYLWTLAKDQNNPLEESVVVALAKALGVTLPS